LGIYPVFDVSWPTSRTAARLKRPAAMANHASTRLYDRRRDEVTLDEVERIVI